MLKMNIGLTAVGMLSAVSLLAGCGKGSDLAAQATRGEVSALMRNTWVSECQPSTDEGQALGYPKQIETVDIGASWQKTTTVYSSDTCAAGTDMIAVTENGNYQNGERVNDNTLKVNRQIESSSIMPLKAEAADKLNLAAACGTRAWLLNGKTVTTGKGPSDLCWAKTPRQEFDVVSIHDSQLFLGLVRGTQDKTSEANRPTEVNTVGFHTK